MKHPISASLRSLSSFLRRHGPYLWLVLLLGFTVYFGMSQQAELVRIRDTILNARREWILGLVLLELVILALVAGAYRALLSRLGHNIKLIPLMGVHLKRVVVGTVTPVGGPSSMVVFIHTLRGRGVKPADALLAVSIKSVIGNIAFLILLLPVVFLQERTPLLLACTAGLIALVGVMAFALIVALRRTKPPAWILQRLPRKALKFLAQIRSHDISIPHLAGPFAIMMATKLCGVLMLFMALRAVGHHPDIQVPLMAYVVGMVFLMVAPVFQGIGVVEVSMAVALQRLGVPPAAAIGATLLCRAGELWLPLTAGILFQAWETINRRMSGNLTSVTPIQ
jgi:uncharacterized membrane protein YbhN (UPF0104 family)